ncbi:hypothetical protein RJT34_29185 [Clitoria ternatea]|uniref:RING-type E3 ubiquitin transferase n=1 Tax=Clitoria ternatea TaxID=43366 RepID=A0AAN9IBZ0_CLITE
MAEFTELFPLGQELDSLVHIYVYIIDLPTLVTICIIVTLFFFILYQILNGLFYWFMVTIPNEHDLEEGISHLDYDPSHQVALFHALAHSSLQAWALVTAFEGVFEDKMGAKLRDSKKLPPLVNYGMHGVTRNCGGDCAICLEEFQVGQFCQVFPMCQHIFHSHCIDRWLQKKLTCPICRRYI